MPPFPSARGRALVTSDTAAPRLSDAELDAAAAALAQARVGGDFWNPTRDPWGGEGPAEEVALTRGLAAGGDAARAAANGIVASWLPQNPYTGAPIGWLELVAILGEWRRLIEANRHVGATFGIARWKRETMDAMLWDGIGPTRYARNAEAVPAGGQALIWAARAPGDMAARLAARGLRVGEVEDGFIRSAGLGANCVPPLSVVVDVLGAHVDPSRPSSIETLIATAEFPPELLTRAAALRETLVASGIGKYGSAVPAEAARKARRQVLVCGQVEDDRAVLLGGAGMTNASLLARARAMEPDADIIWRPHPDVEAGHRKGAIPAVDVARLATRTERSAPITTLFAEADAVHVISSLAGFEALLRGREVITHGLPFYAGWGLTRDLAMVPERRLVAAAVRPVSLDMLVAATLILYPRYLDPVTRLPCGPELLVQRMREGQAGMSSPLVRMRMVWGRLRKVLGR